MTTAATEVKKIAVLPGDGIGVDVTREGIKVLEVLAERFSLPLDLVHLDWCADTYLRTGVSVPPPSTSSTKMVSPLMGFVEAESIRVTSRPAPPMGPSLSAAPRAASSTTSPRAVLMRMLPSRISARRRASMR